MISLEKAKEIYFNGVGEFSKEERIEQVYESIKASIGSCGECIRCSSNDENSPAYNLCFLYGIEVTMSFSCADFKRKQQ